MKSTMAGWVAMLWMGAACAGFAQAPAGWNFEITPYVWLAGLEGDVSVNGRSVEFDKSYGELFDATEPSGSLRIGAQYQRLVVGALVDHLSLGTDEIEVDPRARGGSLESKLLLTEVLAGYRVDGWSEGQTFVLGAGVRNLHAEHDLALPGGEIFARENDVTDAMLFVLPSVPVLPSKIEGLRFNPVLGIGAGDSKLAHELFPQFQYRIAGAVTARLGYRTVGWKSKDDQESTFRMAGLIAGIGLTF